MDQAIRILIDVELISCIVAASGVLVVASLYDLKAARRQRSKVKPRATSYSLLASARELELAASEQAKKADALLPTPVAVIIKTYLKIIIVALPITLVYISYVAIRFRFNFLTILTWASLFGFLVLAVLASEKLSATRKLRLIMLAPAIYWPFIIFSFWWALKIIANATRTLLKSARLTRGLIEQTPAALHLIRF